MDLWSELLRILLGSFQGCFWSNTMVCLSLNIIDLGKIRDRFSRGTYSWSTNFFGGLKSGPSWERFSTKPDVKNVTCAICNWHCLDFHSPCDAMTFASDSWCQPYPPDAQTQVVSNEWVECTYLAWESVLTPHFYIFYMTISIKSIRSPDWPII